MESSDATPIIERPLCKNCGAKLSKRGNFCPKCGQRDFDGRIRMRELLTRFFSNITHLDNKFLKMAWQLLVPGLVSSNYFQGKIKRYPHPVQFFFIVMFFFLLLFSRQFDEMTVDVFDGSINFGSDMSYSAGSEGVTVSKSNLFEALQRCVIAGQYRQAFDSLPDAFKTPESRTAFDSVQNRVSAPWEFATLQVLHSMEATNKSHQDSLPQINSLDSLTFDMGLGKQTVSTRDFVELEPDSILRKYGFKDWGERVLVKQGIKAIKDQKGLINRYVGSLGWSILLLIAVMSAFLWLLYRGSNRWYVEHFIFLMHQQSGAYLFLTLALCIHEFLFRLNGLWLAVLAWFLLFALFSMRRFYAENWWKTTLKWVAFTALYLFSFLVLFIGTMLVVFLIF